MRAKKGLYLHFMSVILPMIVVVFTLIISVFEWSNYEKSHNKLVEKLNSLSTSYALLLSDAVANRDIDVLQYFNVLLITDPDIAYVQIKDAQDKVLTEYGDVLVSGTEGIIERTVSINYTHSGSSVIIGSLGIGMTTDSIIAHLHRQIRYEIILLLALIIIVLLSVRIAYVYAIGRPLASLTKSIDTFKDSGIHTPVLVSQDNELGHVINTYNTMQLQQIEARHELKKHQHNLEGLVEQRTQDLENELRNHAQTATKLFNEKQRIQVTLDSITDAVITTDVEGNVQFLNSAALKLTPLDEETAIGIHLSQLVPLLDFNSREPVKKIIFHHHEKIGTATSSEKFYLYVAGHETVVELMSSPIYDEFKKLSGIAVLIRDITASVKHTSELSYLAQHDMLTGLLNRREFEAQLAVLLEDSVMNNSRHVLFYLDLDYFKIINDQCGHAAGDDVLKQLSIEFKKHLRKGDVIGRIGGDEFGILLVNCDIENASNLAEKIRADVKNFKFEWQGKIFKLGVSIGMVAVNNASESVELLFEKADSSCYKAKEQGRNTVHLHQTRP